MTWPAPCALVEEMKAKSIFRIFFVAFHIKFFSCCLPLKSNPCASIYSVNLSIIESSGPYTGSDQEGSPASFKIFLFFKCVIMTVGDRGTRHSRTRGRGKTVPARGRAGEAPPGSDAAGLLSTPGRRFRKDALGDVSHCATHPAVNPRKQRGRCRRLRHDCQWLHEGIWIFFNKSELLAGLLSGRPGWGSVSF